ncbi:gametocyte-specific factor 1 homolog [Drosophila eugracilis]|uniref:gametocyte-specific factor 1 homolog n=1 Tax=Drosophila eugracilis TaxID=29029 RepID=UPI0007E62BCA|nr:gametocyte-specific factor 1 homolog [Drosophila eugracilis]
MSENKKAVAGPNLENYIICPYNKAHRIMPLRLTFHLVRCAKNYPSSQKIHCPFNTSHWHSVNDMKVHVIDCPDRLLFERTKMPDILPAVEPQANQFVIETEEDWDTEPPAPSYNPQKYCETVLVVRNPQGKSRAARRKFRESERQRFRENGES